MGCKPRPSFPSVPSRQGLPCRRPLLLIALGCAGCAGEIAQPGSSGPNADGEPGSYEPGSILDPESPCHALPTPVATRLLTAYEFDRTVSDLLGEPLSFEAELLADGRRGPSLAEGFHTNVSIDMDRTRLAKYRRAAEKLAELASERVPDLAGCSDGTDPGCVDRFIRIFGRRVFRRPVTEDEVLGLLAVYRSSEGPFEEGIRLVAFAMFQSPAFLYHVERGAPARQLNGFRPLTGFEIASRLSYFLWGSAPSDELLDAAQAGALDDERGVQRWARQLLADPRTRTRIARLHEEWLGLEDLKNVAKTSELLEGTPPDLLASMAEETRSLITHVVFDGSGTLDELLSADRSFVDQTLSELYGVPSSAGEIMDWGDQPRAGVLTHASWLARHSGAGETIPTTRGKFVVNELLCQTLKTPEDLEIPPLRPVEDFQTTRERFEAHSEMPCATACHGVMDPIGFAFEHFDALGRYRATENGVAVNASGSINVGDIKIAFDDAADLLPAIAASEQTQQCYAARSYEYALGRPRAEADRCSVERIGEQFADSKDIQELLVAITGSESFRYKAVCDDNSVSPVQ